MFNNAADWETSGVDVQVDWRFDLGPGRLGVSWLVSWLDSYSVAVTGSSVPAVEKTGTIGESPSTAIRYRNGSRTCTRATPGVT